jgi:hypothetical protein
MRIRKPSPAMTVALIALFVALGGSSYAALKLPKNSVGNKQIKNNAVTAGKVKNGTLSTSDFSAKSRSGLVGPAGPAGAKGANGATNVVMRQGADATIAKSAFGSATATCQPGERATGGGVFNEDNVLQVQVTSSYPTPNPASRPATGNGQVPTGWRVWARNDSATTDYVINAYVICAAP